MAETTARILIVEDETKIAEMLVQALTREGYACEVAHDGPRGLELATTRAPDLVLLDVMLPGMDGTSVCRRLRERSDVPVLMLTARDGEADTVLGLEMGADDYVTKPFSLSELKARIRALLRRAGMRERREDAGAPLSRGALEIDPARRRVTVRGQDVKLTATEFDLLAHMAASPGRVFTRDELLSTVWGYDFQGYDRTVDSHVTRLRKKVEEDPGAPAYLVTVWGVGYRFEVPPG